MIGNIINPNKLLDLKIDSTQTDGVLIVLNNLTNLKSLSMKCIDVLLNFNLLFTQMRALTSLYLHFKDSQATAETLN